MGRKIFVTRAVAARRAVRKSHKRLSCLEASDSFPSGMSIEATMSPCVFARPRKVLSSQSKLGPHSKSSTSQAHVIPKSRYEFNAAYLRRRGLILWRNWDGMSWPTGSLPSHRMSALSAFTSRAMEELTKHEKLLAMRFPNRIVNQFWVLHYRAMLRACHCEEHLTLHQTDTSIITFLLRTAPKSITQHIRSSLRALELNSFELDAAVSSWASFRKVLGHQHNRLYFSAAVFRLQVVRTVTATRMKDRINAKAYRQEVKSSLGSRPFGTLSDKELWRAQMVDLSRPENEKEKFEAFFAALPLRWTIEPLVSYMKISFSRLDRLSNWVRDLLANVSDRWLEMSSRRIWEFRQQALMITSGIKCTTIELHYLTDEYAALRYYRFQICPDSYTHKEIALGRSLWQLLHSRPSFGARTTLPSIGKRTPVALFEPPQADGTQIAPKSTIFYSPGSHKNLNDEFPASIPLDRSSLATGTHSLDKAVDTRHAETASLRTNSSGLFSWDRWDGRIWNTELTRLYQNDAIVVREGLTRKNLEAVEARLVGRHAREVEMFLLARYRTEQTAYARLLPFIQFQADAALLHFLIKTAPLRIFTRLAAPSEYLHGFDLVLKNDIHDLCYFQLALAQLPHNPLSFQTYALKYKLSESLQFSKNQVEFSSKLERLKHKASNGRVFNTRTFRMDTELKWQHLQEQQVRRQLRRTARRLSFPEPLLDAIGATLSRYNVILRDMKRLKQFLLRMLLFGRWHAIARIIDHGHHCVHRVYGIAHDLTALRYFRAHRFPYSVSNEEVEQSHVLADALDQGSIKLSGRQRRHGQIPATRRRKAERMALDPDYEGSRSVIRVNSLSHPRTRQWTHHHASSFPLKIDQSSSTSEASGRRRMKRSADVLLSLDASSSNTADRVLYIPAAARVRRDKKVAASLEYGSAPGNVSKAPRYHKAEEESLKRWLKLDEKEYDLDEWHDHVKFEDLPDVHPRYTRRK